MVSAQANLPNGAIKEGAIDQLRLVGLSECSNDIGRVCQERRCQTNRSGGAPVLRTLMELNLKLLLGHIDFSAGGYMMGIPRDTSTDIHSPPRTAAWVEVVIVFSTVIDLK